MNIEKISPIPPEEIAKGKKARKYAPDSKAFRELMKTGKVGEVDLFEQKRKRKGVPEEEEEEGIRKEPSPPSSSEIYYYKEQEKEAPEKPEGVTPEAKPSRSPTSPSFYKQIGEKKIDPSQEKEMLRTIDKELKSEKKAKAKKKEVFPPEIKKEGKKVEEAKKKKSIEPKPPTLEKEKPISEEAKKIKEAPLYMPKPEEAEKKEAVIKEEKTIKPPAFEAREEKPAKEKPPEEMKKRPLEEKPPSLPEKKEKKEEEELFIPTYQTMLLSPPVQAQATEITSKVAQTLHHEVQPLFQHMIGTIINIQHKGISETQIILNNPHFANSRFYNSTIIFEKYATAPDSFNIRLTGSQEAVTIFNENVEGLYKALTSTDLDFQIGRLSAEYEFYRPLFKRKTFAGDIDKETGEKKY